MKLTGEEISEKIQKQSIIIVLLIRKCEMKNFLIFIIFGSVLYFLSSFIVSWDDGAYTTASRGEYPVEPVGGGSVPEYHWDDEFVFPETLYKRAEFTPAESGRVFYVDPENGSMDGDGSRSHPWKTLAEVFSDNLIQHYRYEKLPYSKGGEKVVVNPDAPVRGGDTLVLLSGNHGEVSTGREGFYFDESKFLTIRAGLGSLPVLSSIELLSASNIYLSRLEFVCDVQKDKSPEAIITFSGHKHFGESDSIIISDCIVRSKGESGRWSAQEWLEKAAAGIVIRGSNSVVRRCRVVNAGLGISVTGNNAVVIENTVKNFCVDGLRGNGSNLVFERNIVRDSFKVDGNHDDGFQSFMVAGSSVYENVILKGNVFLQGGDRTKKLLSGFQGIGCFDGPYRNWTITGNVVIVDNWHGITLMGAEDSVVYGNTVLPASSRAKEGPPWIAVIDSKSGTEPRQCSVEDNTAMKYRLSDIVYRNNNSTIISSSEANAIVKRFRSKYVK